MDTSERIPEEQIQAVNTLLHALLHKLGVHQLIGLGSEKWGGIAPLDLHVLNSVAAKPDIIIKEIKDDMDVPGSTLTSVINRLEERGFLQRVISPRDRRSYGLELTNTGMEIHEEHKRVDRLIAYKVLETLDSDTERKSLITLLATITQRLKPGAFKGGTL